MKKINPFWQPAKIKPFVNLNLYPARTANEKRLINKNPYGDKDKDGVKNFFDCRPLNRKKQEWKPKEYKDSEVIHLPIKKAYYTRGRYTLPKGKYIGRSVSEESKALQNEAERKGKWLRYNEANKLAYLQVAEKEAEKLKKEGYRIKKIRTHSHGGFVNSAIIDYSRSKKLYHKAIKEAMAPWHKVAPFEPNKEAKNAHQYIERLARAIKSRKQQVPMIKAYPSELEKGTTKFGEGRHRILAAKLAGYKTIPIEVIEPENNPEEMRRIKVQEAKDLARKVRKYKPREKPEAIQSLNSPDFSISSAEI